MLLRKAKGKFAVGREPWELMGIKRAAFYARHKAEQVRGDTDGPAHQAMAKALEIGNSREPYAPATVEPETAPVTSSVPAALEPAQNTVPVVVAQPNRKVALSGPTVNVTLRSAHEQHQRLRRMSYETGRPIQSIVSDGVDEYLSKSRY